MAKEMWWLSKGCLQCMLRDGCPRAWRKKGWHVYLTVAGKLTVAEELVAMQLGEELMVAMAEGDRIVHRDQVGK